MTDSEQAMESECEDTYGEICENDEEDKEAAQDLRQYGIYRALPVSGKPDFDSGPPSSAEEYLRRVRYEAQQLPDVVISDINPRAYDNQQSISSLPELQIPAAPDFARPSQQWVCQFLKDFAGIRDHLERNEVAQNFELVSIPSSSDRSAWYSYCFGLPVAGKQTPKSSNLDAAAVGDGLGRLVIDSQDTGQAQGQQPSTSVLLSMDAVLASDLLMWHVHWFTEGRRSLSPQTAAWLFALMARLQRPLTQDIMAAMRALLRHCAGLRAGVKSREDPELVNLNIIIAITGGYFGQDEELSRVFKDES